MVAPAASRPPTSPSRPAVPLAALLAALILLPALCYPLARDQGVFAFVGSAIRRGELPYRDVWEIKPPAIYLTYALLQGLLGPSPVAVHAADLAAAAAVAAALAALARPAFGQAAAVAAGGWYAALYLAGGFWGLAQAESFANVALAIAALAAARANQGGWRWALAVGLAGGAAAAYKITSLLPAAAILGWALAGSWRGPASCPRSGRRRVAAGLAGIGGLALPLVVTGLGMAAWGVLPAYLEIQAGFVRPYAALPAAGPYGGLLAATAGFARGRWLPLALALLGAAAGARAPARHLVALASAWLGAAYLGLALQNKYFGYHWTPLLPPLGLLAGAGLGSALAWAGTRLRAPLASAGGLPLAAALVLAWSLVSQWPRYRDAGLLVAGRMDRLHYEQTFARPGPGDFSPAADRLVAEYVRRQTPAGEGVYIWGFEPLVYYLAERWPPTRFAFNVPQTAPIAPPAWRAELIRDLNRHPPALILVLRRDAVPWASGSRRDSAAELARFPELAALLRERYRLDTQIEDFTIYRRREAAPGAPTSPSFAPPRTPLPSSRSNRRSG